MESSLVMIVQRTTIGCAFGLCEMETLLSPAGRQKISESGV